MLYRSYQKNDAPDICELMDQSFGMNRYVSDPKALRFFLRQYLYSCLSEATYTRVAVENGKVVAIIMGNANRRYRLLPHLPMILLTFYCSARMALRARKSEQTLADDYHLHKLCAKLLGKHKKEFDGVLTLFMVSESLRGHGVGKTLLSGLFDELRTQGVRRMYLFTDTTCNWGFYEHEGFRRLAEQTLMQTRDHQPTEMGVFLYAYDLASCSL